VTESLWSFPAVLAILQEESCEFYASSPVWATFQHYNWYKNLTRPLDRHEHVLRDWRANLAYFLTGSKPAEGPQLPASAEVIQAVATVTARLSDSSRTTASAKSPPLYPIELNRYLAGHTDSVIAQVNEELKRVFDALHSRSVDALLDTYAATGTLRSLWGTAYHYICFQRGFARAQSVAA